MTHTKQIYLKQLFADEGTDPEEEKAPEEKPEEEKEPEKGSDPKDEKKYSDADIDRIINAKFAKWQKDQEKKISEAEKLAGMTAQEKLEHDLEELQKQVASYKEKETKEAMSREARKILTADGINLPDAIIDRIITDDADTTKENVQDFSKLFKQSVQDAVKEALKGKTPPAQGGASKMTKEQILAVKDRAERQRLINENKNLFLR